MEVVIDQSQLRHLNAWSSF